MCLKNTLCLLLLLSSLTITFAQEPRLVLPVGHNGSITSVCFSPDGRKALTTSNDNSAKLWDVATGALLVDLLAHTGSVVAGSFSASGAKIVTGSFDHTAIIWNASSGKLIHTLQCHKGFIQGVEFSNDERKIVTASGDSTAKVWSAETGRLITTLQEHKGKINSVHYSPDGKYIITASDDSTAKIWDAANGKLKFSLTGNKGAVYSAVFSHDGRKIITTSGDNFIRIWDGTNGKLTTEEDYFQSVGNAVFSSAADTYLAISGNQVLQGSAVTGKLTGFIQAAKTSLDRVTDVCYSPDGKFILTTSDDSTASMWEAATNRQILFSKSPQQRLTAAAFSKDGNLLIFGGSGGTAKIYDTELGFLVSELRGYQSRINRVSISPGENNILIAQNNGFAYLWNAEDGSLTQRINLQNKSIYDICFSPGGTMIAASSEYTAKRYDDYTSKIWSAEEGKLLATVSGKINGKNCNSFSPDESELLTISADGSVKIWNTITWKMSASLKGNTGSVISALFSPDGSKIITSALDSTIVIWDAKSNVVIRKISTAVASAILISPDGKKIIAVEAGKSLTLYSLDDSNSTVQFSFKRKLTDVVFSHDSKKIIIAAGDSTVKVWDLTNGSLINELRVVNGIPVKISMSRDDKKILAVSTGGEATIWNALTGKLFLELTNKKKINIADFAVDGKIIVTANADNTSSVWHGATGKLMYTFFAVDTSDDFTLLPSSYYKCSPQAAKHLFYVTADLKVISFEQLDVKYNRPDIVIGSTENPDTALVVSFYKAWQKRVKKLHIDTTSFRSSYTIPEADFVKRTAIDYQQKNQSLDLTIQARDKNSVLTRFNIWVNDVPVFSQHGVSITSRQKNNFDTVITIRLSEGINRIETSVFNLNGIESFRQPLIVNYSPEKKPVEILHFIGIAVDKFLESKYNLTYSSKDIQDLSRKLKDRYKENIFIDTLFNENVTVKNVQLLKQKLLQTAIDDKVIIAYSGHGILSKDFDYYLSTYDIDFQNPARNGLSYDELEKLVDGIPCRKKLILIDACHSGEIDKEDLVKINSLPDSLKKGIGEVEYKKEHRLGLKNSFELMRQLFVNVGKATGTAILSAAAGTSFALENDELKNGVFTYAILEAMNRYKSMSVNNLKRIVMSRVQTITKGQQQPTSRNENIGVDWNVW